MESLSKLLFKNQSYLGKLRARAIYCANAISIVESDSHKQYGPFCGYWDEWLIQAEEMRAGLCESIIETNTFLAELRDFIITLQSKKRLTKNDISYVKEVEGLAQGRIEQQRELLNVIDERILLHKEMTEKLMLVESIDSLSDE